MIRREETVAVGKFHKAHALKGELNATFEYPELMEDYLDSEAPLIVDFDGILTPFFAESYRTKGATGFLIKLDGIDSEEAARELVNKEIYAQWSRLADGDESLMLESDLIGFNVVDEEKGELGHVEDIDDSTANELILVRTPEDSIIYIPLVDDFITGVDEETKTLHVSLPEELLNLNEG